jgi:hypothetical protein
MGALQSLYGDYSNYLKNSEDGTIDFAGGKLTKKGDIATYVPASGGKTITMSTGLDPYQIYKESPDIAKAWQATYGKNIFSGIDPNSSENKYLEYVYGPNETNQPAYTPYQPAVDAVSQGAGPRSGLPEKYQESLLSSIIPELIKASQSYKSDVDKGMQDAQGMYKAITDQLSKETLPGVLNDLANRNVIDSSIASDAIAKANSNIATTAGIQAYQSGVDAAKLKSQYPQILAQIASLGSSSTDDLQKYKLLSDVLINL